MTVADRKLDAATIVAVKKRLRAWENERTSETAIKEGATATNSSPYLAKEVAESIKKVMGHVQRQLDEMLDEAMNSTVFTERG